MNYKVRYLLYGCLSVIFIITAFDLIRISGYKEIPDLPAIRSKTEASRIYFELTYGAKNIDWERLNGSLNYIDNQYDVSDFQIAMLLRIVYEYHSQIPADKMEKIKKTLLKFRYWMDEPGENSMCYWSENHQILFASGEFLAGQLYPDEVFRNSGLTGREHMAKASKRINEWLEMRWKFGFSEFYSNVYYNEDIAGIVNLIDFAGDSRIVKKSEIIMDLLIYDIASQKSNNMFVTVSGRAYAAHRIGGPSISANNITHFLWGNENARTPSLNIALIASKHYRTPGVLLEIGSDSNRTVIKQSNGLNLSELESEGYFDTDDKSIMMQWGMEAYTNPEIISNSLFYIQHHRMFSNFFFKEFKKLDFTFLRLLHLEPALIRFLNPQSNGTVIQRANTYTYKTKYYSLYSVQDYFPGNYSNQVHVSGMNIGNSFSIFHTHPALEINSKNVSPGYWVGYGGLPHVAQDSSVSLSIYNLPDKKAFMESDMLNYTHAYFPEEKFDSVYIIDNYAFGKKGKTYCALIGKNKLHFNNNSTEDLIQPGKQIFWVIEGGDEEHDGSFKNFWSRVHANKIGYDLKELVLYYVSNGKEYKLKYADKFIVDGSVMNTNYARFDSPYILAKVKPDSLEFKFRNKYLHLDFYGLKRSYN